MIQNNRLFKNATTIKAISLITKKCVYKKGSLDKLDAIVYIKIHC